MSALENFEKQQIEKLASGKAIPEFAAGDTVRVNVRIIEGDKERIQAFEGICIARKNRGINSSFTIRKLSHGEGVERVFPLYSPRVESIKVVRHGDVRRAKLYYMRGLPGKAARIKEKREFANAAEAAEAGQLKVVPAPAEEVKKEEAKTAEEKTTKKSDDAKKEVKQETEAKKEEAKKSEEPKKEEKAEAEKEEK